ncbi:MAG: heme o synthase [Myxococcota bacterium]
MNALGSYIALTKPRLLPLVLLSGLPALVLAAGGWPEPGRILVILLGTALAAGAANALNSYLERERDAKMTRTRTRPLPAGALSPTGALLFGLALSGLGTGLLWRSAEPMAALVALAGILFYVFIYTLWLKPRSPAGVIVGGVAGAVAPLIADAAINGSIGLGGWTLFAIIFVWQPPHFWAIALYRRADYEAAGFPTILSALGGDATRRRILLWVVALVPFTLLPVARGLLGPIYGAAALALDAYFVHAALRLVRRADDTEARRFFRVSLVYLMGLFVMMIVDLATRLGAS